MTMMQIVVPPTLWLTYEHQMPGCSRNGAQHRVGFTAPGPDDPPILVPDFVCWNCFTSYRMISRDYRNGDGTPYEPLPLGD